MRNPPIQDFQSPHTQAQFRTGSREACTILQTILSRMQHSSEFYKDIVARSLIPPAQFPVKREDGSIEGSVLATDRPSFEVTALLENP
jgi:hypothetical protein